jgi:hypothetical protein
MNKSIQAGIKPMYTENDLYTTIKLMSDLYGKDLVTTARDIKRQLITNKITIDGVFSNKSAGGAVFEEELDTVSDEHYKLKIEALISTVIDNKLNEIKHEIRKINNKLDSIIRYFDIS